MSTQAHNKKLRSTSIINILSFSILLIDIVLLLALGKNYYYPYSKTVADYLQWVGNYTSFFIGYLLIPLSVIIHIPIALRKGHVDSSEAISIYNRILEKLNKRIYAGTILGIVTLFFAILCICPDTWRPNPPSPPIPGKMVISNRPGSDIYIRVIKEDIQQFNGILIGYRYKKENQETLRPFQCITYPDSASQIDNIAVSHDENYIYAIDSKEGTLRIIGNDARHGLHLIEKKYVGETALGITLSGDGRKLFVSVIGMGQTQVSGKVRVYNVSDSMLIESESIENIGLPIDIYMARKAPYLFVASQGGLNNDPLYIINICTNKPKNVISGFGVISKVIATEDGATAFIIASGNTLYIVKDCLSKSPVIRAINKESIPIRIDKKFIPDSFNLRDSSAYFSSMALTPDGETLVLGVGISGKISYANKTSVTSFGEIISVDVASGKFCDKKPYNTEFVPDIMAIADDGELVATSEQYSDGLIIGDARVLSYSNSHSF